ncbi:LytR/AlgR family response regulator transcription factor [Olivibacter domesticus]|uniref:Two component transcriptional regulator, LytTR family n=1 Tax=Olivibacter domesticus TaxID=407022 RepID=A0A1H7RY54_OLID1|nr:LytTR family DNA-binding domain-containing protein [Olivibacter domesticus]SEL65036.1 two component transcriptional regulator, LytTR family [Olivibacter domesticus]
MIRCLVVDDEPLALDIITDYIQKIPELTLSASTTNAIEGLGLVQQGAIDLVFLDIQMPELTGIQFLKIINGKCDVILTTAYPQYALEGYELNVTDYLLKPIAFDRFYKSVQKVISQKNNTHIRNVVAETPLPSNKVGEFIFVKTEHKIQRIDYDDIYYIEGLKDYISIFTSQERIITLQNMKRMEETLPEERFIRVHKSYIVALEKIESIERGRISLKEKLIPIGDTYKDSFFKRIGEKYS